MEYEDGTTFIFIDGSYFCFYRYHSILTWWKNAYPEESSVLDNPYENEKFVEKFRKTFVDNVKKIPKGLGLDKKTQPVIIVGKDCKREDIWRNKIYSNYKANRANGEEDGFMGGPFFKMAYEDNLFIQGGTTKVLKHPFLEADDCIAISVKHLLNTCPNSKIFIIASDKDYLQLASNNVKIYNLAFKNIAEEKSCTGNAECDLFCKIITGDKSDNIESVFPRCGLITAIKYFNDKALFEKKLNERPIFKDIYQLNIQLIDFNNIPSELVEEFTQTYITTIPK